MSSEDSIWVLDKGNTMWKWAHREAGRWGEWGHGTGLHEVLERIPPMETLIIGAVGRVMQEELEILNRRSAYFIQRPERERLPIKIEYDSYQTWGLDRMAGVLAARRLHPNEDLLIIDAGTCITADFLKDDVYHGGSISPGIQMRLNAMHHQTEKLPLIASDRWAEHIETIQFRGNSTEACLIAGACMGAVLEIDALISAYRKQYSDLKIVLTGGDSFVFESRLKNSIFAHPQLILRGLYELYSIHVS